MDNNEEWNNFMHKVTEISGIINSLTSEDKDEIEKAEILADKYLSQNQNIETDANVDIKLKYDRTLINKCDERRTKSGDSNEIDCESFKRMVEIDAEKRAADRKARTERAETLKTRASRAFRRGDYDLALSCYDKAIEQVKDSCLLYTNRALTLIKLKKYEKVTTETMSEKLERLWKHISSYIKVGLSDESIWAIIVEVFQCVMIKILQKSSHLVNCPLLSHPIVQSLFLILTKLFLNIVANKINKNEDENPNNTENLDVCY